MDFIRSSRVLAFAAFTLLGASILATAQSKDLLYLSYNVPNSLNVDGPGGTFPPSYGGMVQVLEPLVYFEREAPDASGYAALKTDGFGPRLAASWSRGSDNVTWTFKLRKNVKGCNGSTFDADDVIYTFARAKSISGTGPVGYFLSNVGSIDKFDPSLFGARAAAKKAKEEGKEAPKPDLRLLGDEVKKIDKYTVQIRQSVPNKLFLPVLAIFALYMYDKETMEANATEDDPWSHSYANEKSATGFGPYCVANWKKEEQIILKANPDYYKGKAHFDRVVWKKVPESSQRLTVLRAGQADLVDALTPKEIGSLRKVKGIRTGGSYLNSTVMMSLNWNTPPLDNVKLRKAIAYGIPYDQLIDKVYYGSARKWDGLIPPSYPGFHKTKGYNYDPAKAKQMLAEAGFPDGKGLKEFQDAFKLAFVTDRESIIGPVATIVQSSLKSLGIPILLDPMPLQVYADRQFSKKDLGMAFNDTSRPIGIDAAYGVNLMYRSVKKGGITNWGNYSNERVDELAQKAMEEPDNTKRNAMLAEVQEIIMDNVVLVPVLEYAYKYAWRDGIKGVTVHAEAQPRFYDLHE